MFLRLHNSVDQKEVGRYPQIEEGKYPVDLDSDPRSSLSFWFHKADIENTIFPEPVVHQKAKPTDYFPCGIIGTRYMPLVHENLKTVLEHYAYHPVQFIPTKVWHRQQILTGYYYMNCYIPAYGLVDFSRTIVRWSGLSNDKRNGKLLPVSNFQDFQELQTTLKKYEGVRLCPVEFMPASNAHFFFLLDVAGGWGYYVSSQLKRILEEKGFTGMRFLGVNEGL